MALKDIASAGSRSGSSRIEEELEKLNPEQREAALHKDGPLLVVAVAGSGKTHAVVIRLARMVSDGVDPSRILAVTFSRAGAQEMNDRLEALGIKEARVGTFHSVGLEILKREWPEFDDKWVIDDRNRYSFCIKDAVGFRQMNWKAADATLIGSYISMCKANLARPYSDVSREIAEGIHAKDGKASSVPQMLVKAYDIAENLRIERGLLTFDDMLFDAVEMLRDQEDVRRRWASRYDYVIQDEAQDQNLCQLLMGELLAQDHRNYCLVGDPAQTIYTWRGAQPSKLLGFQDTWGSDVVRMGRNYRCGSRIIDAANKSLKAMDPSTRLDIEMIAERRGEDGNVHEGDVVSTLYETLDDEGFGIVEQISAMIADGREPRDFSILYRTNAQSRGPEEALIAARIPYRIVGGTCFYERKEVRDLLAYLRLASGRGRLEDVNRCINTPFRYLGKAFVERVRDAAERAGVKKANWTEIIREVAEQAGIQRRQRASAFDWSRLIEETRLKIDKAKLAPEGTEANLTGAPARILNEIISATGYQQALIKEEGEETTENSKVSNVREMVRAAQRFTNVDDLLDYVDKTIAASKEERRSKSDPNKVTLSSLHRSKGLEWPVVFLAGCSEGILPHGRAESMEEERRLFYVGVTRARDHLYVSSVANAAFGNRVMALEVSRFLAETDLTPAPLAEAAPVMSGVGGPNDV